MLKSLQNAAQCSENIMCQSDIRLLDYQKNHSNFNFKSPTLMFLNYDVVKIKK
jgi:hypothetical protein